MARNVEIKARIDSVEAMLPLARAVAGGAEPVEIVQDDTFFGRDDGRLKLRVFGDGSGELIEYRRADVEGPKTSDYLIVPVVQPDRLREVLARAYGIAGRVRKRRLLLLAGQTRIHLDRVEGLGDFVELEVVLRDEQSEADGVAIADQLIARLRVPAGALVRGAYVDLLIGRAP